jgi:MoaE-MoaD fusion protein
MKRTVFLFAGLRERAGAEIELEIEPETTVTGLLEQIARGYPQLANLLGSCRVAVDQSFVDDDHVLRGDEEIALIPPVSGGHDGASPASDRPASDDRVHLAHGPLVLDAVVALVRHRNAGGIATFTGNVRAQSRGTEVDHLEYEAYEPMARSTMRAIVEDIERRIPGARVAIHHRLGRLEVGETAVVIAASAPHRAEAFAACRDAIEALKQDVPIWKREVSPDGGTWIGRGP